MKNYYTLKKQLEICKINFEALQEKKKMINSFLYPKTSQIKEVPPQKNNSTSDPFLNYAVNTIDIEKQIEILKNEIFILENSILKTEKVLREINDTLYKIFVYRYLDNLKVDVIARKMHLSNRRVYQLLKDINNMVNE